MLAIQGWSQLWQIKKKNVLSLLNAIMSASEAALSNNKKTQKLRKRKGKERTWHKSYSGPCVVKGRKTRRQKKKKKTSQYIWLVEKVPNETTLILCFQCSEDNSVVAISTGVTQTCWPWPAECHVTSLPPWHVAEGWGSPSPGHVHGASLLG